MEAAERLTNWIGADNTPWMYWFLAMAQARQGQLYVGRTTRTSVEHGDRNLRFWNIIAGMSLPDWDWSVAGNANPNTRPLTDKELDVRRQKLAGSPVWLGKIVAMSEQ